MMTAGGIVSSGARRRRSRITRAVARGSGSSGWRGRRKLWRCLHDHLRWRRGRHVGSGGFLGSGATSTDEGYERNTNCAKRDTLNAFHFFHFLSRG
jgi:hypothetical protein